MTSQPLLMATPVMTGAEGLDTLVRFAETAEATGFDILRLMPLPGFEPLSAAASLVPFTRQIVLCAGAHTGIGEPYTLARGFAALDHLSGGRAGWQVLPDTPDMLPLFEDRREVAPEHQDALAQEFVGAAFALWDSWAADAILFDKQEARFSNPDRIRRVDYAGRFIHSRGPLNTPRPPQGRPIIVCDGTEARWLAADIVLGVGATDVSVRLDNPDGLGAYRRDIPSTDGHARRRLGLPLMENWP